MTALTFQGLTLLQPTKTTTIGDSGNIPGGLFPYFNISFTTEGLDPTYVLLTMSVGPAYQLSIPNSDGPMPNPYEDKDGKRWTVINSYESLSITELSNIPVILLDGGNNKIGDTDVNIDGESRTDRLVSVRAFAPSGATLSTFSAPIPQRIILGETRFGSGTVFLSRPPRGVYRIEFYSGGLVAAIMLVTITPGPAFSVFVEGYDETGSYDPFNPNALPTIVLQTRYPSDNVVTLNKLQATLRDAGGGLQPLSDPAGGDGIRNVTITMDKFVGVKNERVNETLTIGDFGFGPYRGNYTWLLVEYGGNLPVGEGEQVAWCDDGSRGKLYSNGGLYPYKVPGELDDVCTGPGVSLRRPLAGMYTLTAYSSCEPPLCLSVYPTLLNTTFLIEIIPGKPFELVFVVEPEPFIEHGYVVDPPPRLHALDVSGNLCTNLHNFIALTVEPSMTRVSGSVASLLGGVASFENLIFFGERGVFAGCGDFTFIAPFLVAFDVGVASA